MLCYLVEIALNVYFHLLIHLVLRNAEKGSSHGDVSRRERMARFKLGHNVVVIIT